ncbi:hypothetical protein [uncultured Campylobacter sp.]|uniref:hypothetical protein n=1 Tax=uncultured Campylobacter sp. TaxID=218934 RepID=UPI002620D5C5|nr:hypothetical protein [uncultured Campylobacter sp.]
MSRAASRLKHGAILNFKSERAAALNFNAAASTALNFNAAASTALNFKHTAALNFKSEQNASLNFTPEQSPALNFNLGSLNFKSRCDEFYRVFLARGSYSAVIASDEILSSRVKNFKAQSSKSGGMKFLKPKFRGEQKEGCDAKHR